MSHSNSLNEVVDGEDSETESESDQNNAEEYEIVETNEIKDSIKEEVDETIKKSEIKVTAPKQQPKKIVKKPQKLTKVQQTSSKPQFKEIKARSKFDIMRLGFGKMIKSTKKRIEKNFKQNKRSKWENAIYDATMLFHEKTLKAASYDLNTIKKESERAKSDCQQSVNHLHQSTIRINKAHNNLKSFCTDNDQYKLEWMFDM